MRNAVLYAAGMHEGRITFGRIAFNVAMAMLSGLVGVSLIVGGGRESSTLVWLGFVLMVCGSAILGLIVAALTCDPLR